MKTCHKCQAPCEEGKSYCKPCRKQIDAEYNQRRDKSKKYAKATARRMVIREWITDYLLDKKCKCGESRLPTLQFHHLRDKKFNIGDAAKQGIGLTKVIEEIKKCEIICANCHAMITSKERNDYKNQHYEQNKIH